MASSLSNLFNNLGEGIHKIKCKYGHDNKKCQTCEIKYKHCECCVDIDDLIEYKRLSCKKTSIKNFDEVLKKRLANTYINFRPYY